MSNILFVSLLFILWIFVLVQGYIVYTLSKEVQQFCEKIITINTNSQNEGR